LGRTQLIVQRTVFSNERFFRGFGVSEFHRLAAFLLAENSSSLFCGFNNGDKKNLVKYFILPVLYKPFEISYIIRTPVYRLIKCPFSWANTCKIYAK
jgi:hypothetical protein